MLLALRCCSDAATQHKAWLGGRSCRGGREYGAASSSGRSCCQAHGCACACNPTKLAGHVLTWQPRLQAANAAAANAAPHPSDYDPTNTTLFIGGLSAGVSEDDLRNLFGRFGEIVYTKIPPGKGCGFVQFVQRAAAEAAMAAMQARA